MSKDHDPFWILVDLVSPGLIIIGHHWTLQKTLVDCAGYKQGQIRAELWAYFTHAHRMAHG